jgi:hypothetical protein
MTKALTQEQDSYKVVDTSMIGASGKRIMPKDGGRYVGTSPMKAGKKAAKQIFILAEKDAHAKHADSVVFQLRQSTQGSSHKTHFYRAKKVKAPKGATRKFKTDEGTREVQIRFTVEIEPADEADFARAVQDAKKRHNK